MGDKTSESSSLAIREYDERYEFIRPLLICQINEETEEKEFKLLETQLEKIILNSEKEEKIASGSVYFRDLNSGRWVGINELEPHSPASLLKVPIMMTYFKESENNSRVLENHYLYQRDVNDINPLVQERLLRDGQSYSVRELMRGMIVQSDNSAKDILVQNADPEVLKETYSVLGLANPYGTSTDTYQLSAKKYALFFRVLYNGTFLTREQSNKAAQLLSEVEFDKGLRAGIPSNIKIAHKYGIKVSSGESEPIAVELSDCGIVYHPNSPYLLCIMLSGKNPYVLADTITNLTETVNRFVTIGER